MLSGGDAAMLLPIKHPPPTKSHRDSQPLHPSHTSFLPPRGDAAVLVFHGYNPRCTAKEVVLAVAGALLQRSYANVGATGAAGGGAGGAGGGGGSSSSSGAAVLRRIVDDIRAEPLERHAFVVLHNLDGPGGA